MPAVLTTAGGESNSCTELIAGDGQLTHLAVVARHHPYHARGLCWRKSERRLADSELDPLEAGELRAGPGTGPRADLLVSREPAEALFEFLPRSLYEKVHERRLRDAW